jgi:hypothetical protein
MDCKLIETGLAGNSQQLKIRPAADVAQLEETHSLLYRKTAGEWEELSVSLQST